MFSPRVRYFFIVGQALWKLLAHIVVKKQVLQNGGLKVNLTQELLYLLLLYAVLSDNLSLSTALMIAIGIILLAPCLSRLCCPGGTVAATPLSNFATLNNLV